jgi:hypothetical protein
LGGHRARTLVPEHGERGLRLPRETCCLTSPADRTHVLLPMPESADHLDRAIESHQTSLDRELGLTFAYLLAEL